MAKKQQQEEPSERQIMIEAAKRGLEEQGYTLSRNPGRGLSNIWTIERNGKAQTASIRTSRNRWFAFPPLENGTRWKTLDDVDLVVVSTVDKPDDARNAVVYLFDATEVRKRFDAAYTARKDAGQTNRDDFGMWIALDLDDRDIPTSVGSGLAQTTDPIAIFDLQSLEQPRGSVRPVASAPAPSAEAPAYSSIAEVMAWARQRVSEIAGVRVEAVKLDLKIEY